MADDAQFGWVFDSLVGFLTGPAWDAAVMTFIEQKSVVFDPETANEEEYKKIHQEYNNLVDAMLGAHMEDLGITPEQFEQACGETQKSIHSQFRRSLFEQIWAADDYEIFKRMMTQKNIELQLQAIDLLAHQYGLLPSSLLPDSEYEPSSEERSIMQEVMKRYETEYPEQKEEEHIDDNVIQATKVQLEAQRQREKELLEKAMEMSLLDNKPVPAEEETVKPIQTTGKIEVSPEEARRRQEYLRQQRDRLLALKRNERQKQLRKYEEMAQRPKSAKTAKRLVEDETEKPTLDPATLAFRRSLAARLKAEVIEGKNKE